MKKFFKLLFLVISFVFVSGCSSDKDCTKTITTESQSYWTPSGMVYIPGSAFVVPCDYVIPPVEVQKPIDNFSYEVLNFKFTPDTGKNTSRLQFEIKLNNLNNFVIKGYPVFTVNADGLESSGTYLKGAISTCNQIDAKSSCTFTFDTESSLEIGKINSLKLVTVKYYLLN
jgi:hypothetical protein